MLEAGEKGFYTNFKHAKETIQCIFLHPKKAG